MKIAICDDNEQDRAHIRRLVVKHNKSHEITEFNSAIPLLKCIYEDVHFDVLFLDIQMPDSDGWEVAELLKRTKINIYIAMVTINDNYIYDSFDRVDWFAPKPMSEAKIYKILNNAYDKLFPVILEFITDKMPLVLTAPEIMYIEVKRNYVFIHTIN